MEIEEDDDILWGESMEMCFVNMICSRTYIYMYIYTYHLIMYYIYNRDILYMTVDCSLTIETLRSFVSELTRAEANNPTWFSAEPLDVSSIPGGANHDHR